MQMKRSNARSFQVFLCVVLTFLILAAAACVPQHYSENDKKDVEEASRKLLTQWLETLPEDCTLTEVSMVYGNAPGENPYTGYYLSQVSLARFSAGDKKYTAYVNNEDGSIWTDYYGIDAGKYLEELLQPYCGERGFASDLQVTSAYPVYKILSHGSDSWNHSDTPTEVYLSSEEVYPADITPENADERMPEFLRESVYTGFRITYLSGSGLAFDPNALADFVKDAGNGKAEGDITSGPDGYIPDGRAAFYPEIRVGDEGSEDEFPRNSVYEGAGFGRIDFGNDPEKALFDYQQYSLMEGDGILMEYLEKGWEGNLSEFDPDAIESRACPVEIDGDTVRYTGGYTVGFYFTEEPAYTKATRRYLGEDADEEAKELKIVQLENGYWSLDNEAGYYPQGYFFDNTPQEIVFE